MNRWIIVLISLIAFTASGQQLTEREWLADQPMSIADVERSENGDIYVAATIYNNSEDTAAAIAMKFNPDLQLEWAKQLRTFNDDDLGCVRILSDGNILFGGGLGAFFSPLLGGSLYKLDSDGNVLWAKVYPASNDDRISEIFELNNGELLLANRRGVSGQPTFFIHTDSGGNILDQFILSYEDQDLKPTSMTFDGTNFYAVSRVYDDALEPVLLFMAFNLDQVVWARLLDPGQEAVSGLIHPKPGGGFAILGQIVDAGSVFNGMDIWLFETDAQGNPSWSKRLYREGNGFTELGSGLLHLPGGELLVSSRFQTEMGFVPVFAKIDDQTNLDWVNQSLGSSMSYLDLLPDDLALLAGPSLNGGVGLGTSSIDGTTACGSMEIDIQFDDMSISSTDVDVVFDVSAIAENVPEFNSIDLSYDAVEICSATLGLENQSKSDFHIYPNPVSGDFFVEGVVAGSLITIADISGRVLVQQILKDSSGRIALSHFNSGMYLVMVDGLFAGRIMVQE